MRYRGEVSDSHNELRMIPVSEDGQATLEARIKVRPLTWSNAYTDHWGTQVMAMESQTQHEVLDIEATSLVELSDVPPAPTSVGWEALADDAATDRLCEFLQITPRTTPSRDLTELAVAARSAPTPREAAIAVAEQVHGRMVYQRGITGVQATAADAWGHGKGVCQDFAHVTLAGLRAIGIPSRYVSGYTAGGSEIALGETVRGDSHAWVEFWDGAWQPLDPTNLTPVGADYVVVGRGRDYDDVSPFRGMYVGPSVAELVVEVDVTRLS